MTSTTAEQKPLNMRIWDRVSKTDPSHTKPFSRSGGFKGTAIKPMYSFMKATEYFGPIGLGWGWDLLETRWEGNAVFCLVSVWYVDPETGGEKNYRRTRVGPQWGGTEAGRQYTKDDGTPGKFQVDDEAPKKSVTDAVTKCLSYLGFGADVHLGQFDDAKYVAELKEEIKTRGDVATGQSNRQADELWAKGVIALIDAAATVEAVTAVGTANAVRWKEVNSRNPDIAQTIVDAGAARKKALTAAA